MASNWNIPVSRVDMASTRGTLSGRLMAYIVDLIVIAILVMVFRFAFGILGFVTFGLAWTGFALPYAFFGVVYSALTISSSAQATFGMRFAGVRLTDARTGGTVPVLNAAVHALLFYVAASTGLLLALDLVIGWLRADSRFGHDLIAGVIAVRS